MTAKAETENPTWREDRYREILRYPKKNDLLVKIWRDAYGEDYPSEADPFGFATLSDLDRFCKELHLNPRDTLLDIGCGRGGPGSWVATKLKVSLIGIDLLPEAIAHANEFKGSAHARFSVGSFTHTHLPAGSVHGIMSVDAFWMVLNKPCALREMARVIRPSGRFILTTWIPSYLPLEPMLKAAGFKLVSCQESCNWKERQMAVYDGILQNRKELARTMDPVSTEMLIAEAELAPRQLASAPRFFVVSERN